MFGQLDEIEVTMASPDGLVRATVGARGQLVALKLDPRIYRGPDATTLAAEVTRTIRTAAEAAQRNAFDAMAPLLPPGATFENTDLAFDPVIHHLDSVMR